MVSDQLVKLMEEACDQVEDLVTNKWDDPANALVPSILCHRIGGDNEELAIDPEKVQDVMHLRSIVPALISKAYADRAILICHEQMCQKQLEEEECDHDEAEHDLQECITLIGADIEHCAFSVYRIGRDESGIPYLMDDEPISLEPPEIWAFAVRSGVLAGVASTN